MTILEFLASLVASLAWPATVALLAIIFRKSVGKVLLTLTALRYKGLEVDFKREFSELEEAANSVNLEPAEAQPQAIGPGEDAARTLEEEVEAVAAISPAAAISLAWTAVDSALKEAVQRLAILPDHPAYTSAVKNLRLLQENSDLDPDTSVFLARMRQLRNRVVHGQLPPNTVSSDEATEYGRLAQGLVRMLGRLKRLP